MSAKPSLLRLLLPPAAPRRRAPAPLPRTGAALAPPPARARRGGAGPRAPRAAAGAARPPPPRAAARRARGHTRQPPARADETSASAQGRRVITGLRHGGHAIVDAAPGAAAAVDVGAVRLSEVTQDVGVAGAGDVAAALALAGVTDFDYLFPELVGDPAKLLPADPTAPAVAANTVAALNDLGAAMIEQGAPQGTTDIPPIMTYWGQFVDHDLTAATDNDRVIGIDVTPLTPLLPTGVVALLKNQRNPALNLDSVYGDGPFAQPAPG